ncbi:MAG TPA: glycosyltransferase family 4 protein [Steroidobacteraceae bacterium]|nr:glycosyltransferase family 4 protein [Steroidobacteraceae bacterium]
MKILVLGVRGIPNVPGGVETHAEELYERIAGLGCDVEVVVRTPYVPANQTPPEGVRLRRIWAPSIPGPEALIHSLLGVLYAGIARPDILHIHAVGPAIVTPIARLLGLHVVVTHHGPDYDRDKWGWFARLILRAGEHAGMHYSHARIAISKVIADLIRAHCDRGSDLIPNGTIPADMQAQTSELERYGLTSGRYFLQVSRIVPEKRQLDLIDAYVASGQKEWKLVLVGPADVSDYSRRVTVAAEAAGVVLAGLKKGAALKQLYSHAGGFVLPSSHEGLPIAILEALSYGLPVIASNIPANLEIGLDADSYFPVGDLGALTHKLQRMTQTPQDEATRDARKRWVAERYDWSRIAVQTLDVYRKVLGDRPLGDKPLGAPAIAGVRAGGTAEPTGHRAP